MVKDALTNKNGLMLRKLLLMRRRGWWNKTTPVTLEEALKYLNENDKICKSYIIQMLYRWIIDGILVYHHTDYNGWRRGKKFYLINEKLIFDELFKDKIYVMDEEIINNKYSIMIE